MSRWCFLRRWCALASRYLHPSVSIMCRLSVSSLFQSSTYGSSRHPLILGMFFSPPRSHGLQNSVATLQVWCTSLHSAPAAVPVAVIPNPHVNSTAISMLKSMLNTSKCRVLSTVSRPGVCLCTRRVFTRCTRQDFKHQALLRQGVRFLSTRRTWRHVPASYGHAARCPPAPPRLAPAGS